MIDRTHSPKRFAFLLFVFVALAVAAGGAIRADEFDDRVRALKEACIDFETVARADVPGKKAIRARAKAAEEYRACVEREAAAIRIWAVRNAGGYAFSAAAADDYLDAQLGEAESLERRSAAAAEFLGMKWGIGFGVSIAMEDHIEVAEIFDGVIRVTEDRSDLPRAVFEFHHYFGCTRQGEKLQTGCGFFGAVASTSDEVLSGVGAGFMYGWRSEESENPRGLSIGVGAIFDGNIRTLADGFEVGRPLPPGATSIGYETKSRWSYLIIFSRSF